MRVERSGAFENRMQLVDWIRHSECGVLVKKTVLNKSTVHCTVVLLTVLKEAALKNHLTGARVGSSAAIVKATANSAVQQCCAMRALGEPEVARKKVLGPDPDALVFV